MVLADYKFGQGEGLYTDMNAIRPDEECLDNLHSVYVDQWDWERIIGKEERTLEFLKSIVRKIYNVLKETEVAVHERYPDIEPILPAEISFIHSEELLEMYPGLEPREREDQISQKYGAVFVIGIGGVLHPKPTAPAGSSYILYDVRTRMEPDGTGRSLAVSPNRFYALALYLYLRQVACADAVF